jgi:SpoIVB peptidase S55
MSGHHRRWGTRAGAFAIGLVLAASLAPEVPAAEGRAAPAAPAAAQCPGTAIMPVDQVTAGMLGSGLTVTQGRTPQRFDVEVLGVLPDEIAPGRDMIVVEASGPPIDKAGGIWFGMSGSPVYVSNQLIGAVAFGFSATSPVAGLTPAEDMVKILDFPTQAPAAAALAGGSFMLPGWLEDRIVRRTEVPRATVDEGLQRLKLPFTVSGVSGDRIAKIKRVIDSEELPLLPHSGPAAQAGVPAGAAPLEPGDSFAAALSYGDVTQAGIGTTTMVCGDEALAFGHPFFFHGSQLQLGANAADTMTIIRDDFWGPYKLAAVAEGVGLMDQDRLAGIRALLGVSPDFTSVTSTFSALNTRMSRDGRTEIVHRDFVPFTTFAHLFGNIDSVFDQITGGSSTLRWRLTGTTETGATWELNRSNLYADEFDISFATGFEILGQLFTLLENDFEEIEFSSVELDGRVEEDIKLLRIEKVLVSLNGGDFVRKRRIRVSRGDLIGLRVVLVPFDEVTTQRVDLRLRVPRRARRSGEIEVVGGSDGPNFECFFFGENCASEKDVDSLEELIEALENAPTNNQLIARLRLGARRRVQVQDVETLDQVVDGRKRIRLIVR